jgi:periplasmic divalent cation tolerance protein
MTSSRTHRIVLVTVPNLKTARHLARTVLSRRLAACANLVPRIESHYWWKGKIEKGSEILLVLKTTRQRLAALESAILENHPYETPEFVVLQLEGGSAAYLGWLDSSLKTAA